MTEGESRPCFMATSILMAAFSLTYTPGCPSIRRGSALNLLELSSCSDTTSKSADRLPPVTAMLGLPQLAFRSFLSKWRLMTRLLVLPLFWGHIARLRIHMLSAIT